MLQAINLKGNHIKLQVRYLIRKMLYKYLAVNMYPIVTNVVLKEFALYEFQYIWNPKNDVNNFTYMIHVHANRDANKIELSKGAGGH